MQYFELVKFYTEEHQEEHRVAQRRIILKNFLCVTLCFSVKLCVIFLFK